MITIRRRLSHGFFYRLNYTYGKSIDDASASQAGGQGAPQRVQDPNNRHGERGRSNWDSGHVFTMNYSYLIPWHGPGWTNALNGWQVAGTGRASSGQPFTPRVSNVNLNQGGAFRPDRLSRGSEASPGPEKWFDLAAFPAVPAGVYRFGTSGRNILDGPGFVGINVSLVKNSRIREKTNLQFRWEVFNVLNHANFGPPNVSVYHSTGGTITTAGPGRLMQLALRLDF